MSDTKREANVSEIETLDITEAEERAGLRRVYDLVGELPIPPDKTRKLAGYIARIEADRDKALARHGLFMVEGGPVVMATEYDALKDELSQARASIASYNAGKDNLLRTIAALRDEARAAAQAMSRPVSDEEWEYRVDLECDREYVLREDVNALIAARARDSKSAPARADEASK